MLLLISISLAINILAILSGTLLTESKLFSLAPISKKLDRKPFNCKPCLTFHILWIAYAVASIIIQSWIFFIIGLIFSFSIFGVLYLEDKSKITK